MDHLEDKVHEWLNDLGVAVDEVVVKVCKAQERLNLLDSMWGQPAHNHVNLHRIHSQTIWGDDEAQIFDRGTVEICLAKVHMEVVVMESLEDRVDMAAMFVERGGIDEDVIKIDYDI